MSGNARSLHVLREQVRRIWFKWLNRRSQRRSLDWERFDALARVFPLPPAQITIVIWGG